MKAFHQATSLGNNTTTIINTIIGLALNGRTRVTRTTAIQRPHTNMTILVCLTGKSYATKIQPCTLVAKRTAGVR